MGAHLHLSWPTQKLARRALGAVFRRFRDRFRGPTGPPGPNEIAACASCQPPVATSVSRHWVRSSWRSPGGAQPGPRAKRPPRATANARSRVYKGPSLLATNVDACASLHEKRRLRHGRLPACGRAIAQQAKAIGWCGMCSVGLDRQSENFPLHHPMKNLLWAQPSIKQ